MKIGTKHYQSIWLHAEDLQTVQIIDQRFLPHEFVVADLKTVDDVVTAIRDMWVRGAPLIGATAAFGMYLACLEASTLENPMKHIHACAQKLLKTRPTAVNLQWAIKEQLKRLEEVPNVNDYVDASREKAVLISKEDAEICHQIGQFGLEMLEDLSKHKNGARINILTHCNAGWLACVDWGTATSPIYQAFDKGIDVHVWVDETRPRNQGARITAWELEKHGIPHTIIADNTGGHLMQHGMVDVCIVGTDRTTRSGDVANKIGTYLKALAAHDNGIPFYVALPSRTIDWEISDGLKEIPIEERSSDEVKYIYGLNEAGERIKVLICPIQSDAANYAFDVTPGKYITGLITEHGICCANEQALRALFDNK